MSSSRKEIADGLKKAAASYLLKKRYACHMEIGIQKWGKRKADVLAVNMKADLILVEVKSCVADFTTDSKWHTYLPASNRMYFCLTEKTARLLESKFDALKKVGVGVLVLDKQTGYLRCIMPAKHRPMTGRDKKDIIVRLAWRNGDISKRNSRRTRVFLED